MRSTRLFLLSYELGPSHASECVLSPFGSGGGTQLACVRVDGIPIRTRGQTLWYSRYICTLWWEPKRRRAYNSLMEGTNLVMIEARTDIPVQVESVPLHRHC